MYISQLLFEGKASKNSLINSIIEPDSKSHYQTVQYAIKKIPLADKAQIKEYSLRNNQYHQNIPRIQFTQTSNFYLNVQLQKVKAFDPRDMIKLPFYKRAKLLVDIIKGVKFLVQSYGYFYLTEKMLSFGNNGSIIVWINQDYFANRPQYPINHGKLSEEIFVADFKETFCGNFQEIKQFRKTRNLSNLLNILNRGQDIYHRNLLSEPISKESLIERNEALQYSNLFNSHYKENAFENRFEKRTLKHTESSQNILNVNFQNEVEDKPKEQGRKLTRMLSSPCSIAQISENKTYGSMTSSNLPRINFNYMSKQAWKKKQVNEASPKLLTSIKLSTNQNPLRQTSKQMLKVSFPYTTTHSFSPISSFGSINLNSREQIIQSSIHEEMNQAIESKVEEVDDMQQQFETLFQSNIMSQQQLQNLEVIMEQFQNILQA